MKHIIFLISVTFFSCSRTNNFYQGRVTDENNNPLENVIVSELYRENKTRTDKNGYFNFEKYSSTFSGDLVFVKNGYQTDTIPTVWHQAGETTEYNFVKNDTTIIRLRLIDINERKKLKKELSNLKKDTLQYIMDGENEDNIYAMFLTRKLDTLRIVLENNQQLDVSSKNKMYLVEWQNELMTSGGDSEIKYQQAFMKKMTEIKTKTFK